MRRRLGRYASVAEARLLGWAGLRLYGVQIGRPRVKAAWAQIRRIDVTFGPAGLLGGDPRPTAVVVEDPEIHLPASAMTPFHLAGLITKLFSGKGGESRLRSIEIDDGVLIAHTPLGERRMARINLSIECGPDGVSARGSAWPNQGLRPDLSLGFRARFGSIQSLKVEGRQAVDFRLEDGALTVTRTSLRRTLRLAPITGDFRLLGAPAPSIRFQGDCGKGPEKAKVFALLESPGGRPSLQADVRAGIVNVAPLREALQASKETAAGAVARAPLGAMGRMRTDVRVSVREIRGWGPELQSIEARVKSDGQGVTLDKLRFAFPGGSADGAVSVRRASPPQWKAETKAQVRSLRTLRAAFGSLQSLAGLAPYGTGRVTAALAAGGATASAVLGSLTGEVAAEFRNLSFAREGLPAEVRQVLANAGLHRVELVDAGVTVTARKGFARIDGASRLRFTPLRAYVYGEADLRTADFYLKISMTRLTDMLAPGKPAPPASRSPLFLITGMPLRVTRQY